jgi:dienelactone hydrolase
MKFFSPLLKTAIFSLALLGWNVLSAQQVFKTTPTSVIGFLEYLPADYNTNTNKYPIVIFLHGLGERGTNTTDIATLQTSIVSVTKLGPPKYVKNGTQFPFILISPQLKNNYGDWPTSYVMEVLNYVKTYLRVDERRIYLTGLSLGGGGTWNTAQDNPTLFAAIAPVCGSRNSLSKACLLAAENLPVWAFHGDSDDVVPLSRSVDMVNAINNCSPAPTPRALLTIYPGVMHNAWDRAYQPDNTYHNPNVYAWLMSYTNTKTRGNYIPIANAGSDISTKSNSATVTASATDSDGTIASYAWTKMSGGTVTLANTNTNALKLSNMVEGTFLFRLTVTDNSGNVDADYVTVTYKKNVLPVANAGADGSVTLPTTSITLTGSATDSDGTVSSYLWSLVSGPSNVTFSNASSSSTTASGLTAIGKYTLKLTVKDNNGAAKSDNVDITVSDGSGRIPVVNALPIANAGSDFTISLPTTTASVIGSGSDTDGSISAYNWQQVSGPTSTLTNGSTSTLLLSNLNVTGRYEYELRVTDNQGAINTDRVVLTVAASTSSSTARIAPEATALSEDLVVATNDDGDWNDKHVSVFNANGVELYSGVWSEDMRSSVFSSEGMYLYKVRQAGSKVSSGKIMILP